MKLLTTAATSLLLIGATNSFSQDELMVFHSPTVKEYGDWTYPRRPARDRKEGWVVINAMIDTEGNPYELVVVDSEGDKEFETAAIRTVERSKYNPATLNGSPTEGSVRARMRFVNGDDPSLTRGFRMIQQRLERATANNDQEKASSLLARLEQRDANNLTELALLNIAKYNYSFEFKNDIDEQAYHLERAIHANYYHNDDGVIHLPKETLNTLRTALFVAQVQRQRFGEASLLYQMQSANGIDMSPYANTIEQMDVLKNDLSEYSIKAKTDDSGFFDIVLFKPGFSIDNLGNRISEIKLHCEQKRQFFSFTEGLSYTIPESWGTCDIYVLGDANVEFELLQFRD